MDINRLRRWELVYEIRVRGFVPQNTVVENRQLLRQIFSRERNGEHFEIVSNFEVDHELEEIRKTLESLSEELDFSSDPSGDIRRLRVRFAHVRNRLDRVNSETPEQQASKSKLGEILSQLESVPNLQVGGSINNGHEVSILDMPNPLLPEILHDSFNPYFYNKNNAQASTEIDKTDNEKFDLPGTSSPRLIDKTLENLQRQLKAVEIDDSFKLDHMNPPEMHACNTGTITKPHCSGYAPVYKWNISFDGNSSVTDFLERIDEISVSRGVSKDQLLRSAPELFSKSALVWYRSIRDSVHTWSDLVHQLKQTFLPYDYEFALREEINRRSQGSEEKIAIYVSVMQNLFNRLSQRPSESERVLRIRRNLLPEYQRALAFHSIGSVAELVRLGSQWEEANNRASRFKPPPNQDYLLGPFLSYHRSRVNEIVTDSVSEMVSHYPSGNPSIEPNITAVNNAAHALKCFNCGSHGHIYKSCPQPLRKRCFKCQTPNCTTRTCQKCNLNSENFKRRN